jgi:DNA-directed RNA polymerase specialized sigma24 family protein
MADRDAWEQPLYRFAYLLLRDREAARKTVVEALETGVQKRPPSIDPEQLIMLQFREVRRKALKNQTATSTARIAKGELPAEAAQAVSNAETEQLETILHALPEPGRSAYALLLLDGLESEWIAKMLGMAPAEFGDVVQGARLAVQQALLPKPETAQ